MTPHPILSSLRHHKLTAILLMMQVALTCAIVSNVMHLVVARMQTISVPSGLDEKALSIINTQTIDKNENALARHETDLAALRAIPGVTAAVAVDSLPFGGSMIINGSCSTLKDLGRADDDEARLKQAGCASSAVYSGNPGEIGTLGLKLMEGRDFRANEYAEAGKDAPAVILSRAMAKRLFPGKDALGKLVFMPGPELVVGVVDTLLQPNPEGTDEPQLSLLLPSKPNGRYVMYALRSAPQDRARVMAAAPARLMQISPDRIIGADDVVTFEQMRNKYFQHDITMIGLLIASCLGLLFVTALGISGLANFWVQQRRKQIGVRRAIGATRGDILRYFQTENFLIVTGGILLGIVLAVLLNLLLMKQYELPRLPTYYLGIGALALWVLGQLAVLGPALRAAAVPPVVATRSV